MKGFKNRKTHPLPKKKMCTIEIVTNDENFICRWYPFNPKNYTEDDMPSAGYLGCASQIPRGIGFNAWEQNDSEFIYYKRI